MMFVFKSGVRQGGMCSAWLFNLYINELTLKLKDSRLGCSLGGQGRSMASTASIPIGASTSGHVLV